MLNKKTLITIQFLLSSFLGFSQIDSTLFEAISNNNYALTDSIVSNSIAINAINATDENGANALMWACYHADSAMVALLFNKGAKSPAKGGIYYDKETILKTPIKGWYGTLQAVAAGRGKTKILQYLLDVQKNTVDEQALHPTNDSLSGWTALMHAAHLEKGSTLKMLLEYKASVNKQNAIGYTASDITEDILFKQVLSNQNFSLLEQRKLFLNNKEKVSELFYKEKYNESLSLAESNLNLCRSIYGENHLTYIMSLSDLGALNTVLGKLEKALPFLEESLPLIEKVKGKNHSFYITGIGNLGVIYSMMDLNEKALPYAIEALSITENTLGRKHKQYGIRLNNLATIYTNLGMYDQALQYALLALKSTAEVSGKKHKDYSNRLNNLSVLYSEMNLNEKALQYALEAKQVVQNTIGTEVRSYGIALFGIGNAYEDLKDYENAEKFYLEALENTTTTLGKEHLDYPLRLSNLATLYLKMKRHDEALHYSSEALKSTKGNGNLKALRMTNLAIIHEELKEYDVALKLKKEAIEITNASISQDHPDYGIRLFNLGVLYHKMGDFQKAQTAYSACIKNANNILKTRLPFVSIQSQTGWKKKYSQIQHKFNSFIVTHDLPIPFSWVEYNIRLKELIASNAVTISESDSYGYKTWLSFKRQISKELNKPIANQNTESITTWTNEIELLETKLLEENKVSIIQKSSIDFQSLKSNLSSDEAIVDFVNFRYFDNQRQTDTILYLAYLIKPGRTEIQAVSLFEEKELQAILEQKVDSKINLSNHLYASETRGLTPSRNKNFNDLGLVWVNLIPHLKGVKKIYFSPSGLLNKINFGAITIATEKDTMMASDRFELIQYTNLRSMIYKDHKSTTDDFLILGGLNYDYSPTNEPTPESEVIDSFSTVQTNSQEIAMRTEIQEFWTYLPGTRKEITEVESILKSKLIPHTVYTENAATEEKIKEVLSKEISPKVLHFSTHGFFYPDVENRTEEKLIFKASDNPMVRTGLILSGANYTWQSGDIHPDRKEDGILTAHEVANLNLTNTELVVLSACETGLGDIQGSEGIYGLRRAFKLAGARYVMMSLWKVPDEATQRLMVAFYNNWLDQKMDIRLAFNKAQEAMRADYDSPYYWAGFILIE